MGGREDKAGREGGSQYLHATGRPEVHSSDRERQGARRPGRPHSRGSAVEGRPFEGSSLEAEAAELHLARFLASHPGFFRAASFLEGERRRRSASGSGFLMMARVLVPRDRLEEPISADYAFMRSDVHLANSRGSFLETKRA